MRKFFLKFIITLFVLSNFLYSPVYALTATDYNNQLKYYNSQAEKAKQQAAQKAQEANQLKNQLEVVSSEITSTENAINSTATNISKTTENVSSLTDKIKVEEDNLAREKDKMGKILSSWYMEGESGLFEAMIGSENLSELITQQEYYESIRQQVESAIENIEKIKGDLNAQKTQKENELARLNDLKDTQEQQKDYLENKQALKSRLLTNTKSAIEDLNEEAQRAEAKAQEIRKILASIYSNSKGTPKGSNLISSVDSSWYYNQRNYDTRMSPSRMTIAEVGCLITSYAMVATFYGHSITPPGVVAISRFGTDGAWYWFTGYIGANFETKRSVNWDVVNNELAAGRPVIVSVRKPWQTPLNSDGSSHWIVIKGLSNGKYLIHDPYWSDASYDIKDVYSMKLTSSN